MTRLLRALALYEQGKVNDALETYQKGLKLMPDDLGLHYNLGILLRDQGQKEEAVKELREALRIDPNYSDARRVLNSLSN